MEQVLISCGVWEFFRFLGPRGFHVTNQKSHTPFDPRGVGGYKKYLGDVRVYMKTKKVQL